jgi:dipeptidase E
VTILLGSGGFRTPERIAVWAEQMRSVLGGIRRVLFVPYALADHDGNVRTMTERGINSGYELVGIHTKPDPIAAIRSADAIFVGGGNTFRLLATLYRLGLLDPIRERVRSVPYLGISAGTNVACPTIKTTNDMPIVQPASFEALGLVPFQINCHYLDPEPASRHMGETRETRLREYLEENDSPVVGLREGAWLEVEGDPAAPRVRLCGPVAARIFRRGAEPLECPPGAPLELARAGAVLPPRPGRA